MIVTNNDKKKRVSKKRKSSWRKHVNVQDVEEFLEDQRLEERLGEPLGILKDEQLFTIETDGSEKQLTTKQKKRLRLAAPPKCFAMLQPHTKVPDPIKKRNRVRTRDERMCPILKKKENERKLKGILKPREMQSIKDRKKYDEKFNERNADNIVQDIWTVTDNLDNDPWIERNTKRHTLRGLGKLNKVVLRLQSDKNVAIPNIEIPHPGISYNPSLYDHTNLLRAIAEKEAKIIKEEEHIKRVTKDMFRKVPVEQTNSAWMSEMSQGLPKTDQPNEEQVENNDKPYTSINPPVINNKKTLKQRRKQKEQLLLKETKLQAKLEKKKTVDIHKLKTIKQQIESREKKLEKQRMLRAKLKTLKEKEPKQLSKLKYEEPDVEFSMMQDLTGDLRNLRKQGSLLTDRFRSLQKRNIIEVSARQHRKKAKVKKYVKAGFKDNWKETVANKNIFKLK